jgi:hypothetical protein
MTETVPPPRSPRGATLLVGFGIAALLVTLASNGGGDSADGSAGADGCSPCGGEPCFDGLPMRPDNGTCCACPPAQWAMHEVDYPYLYAPPGLRTLRLYYELQPGQVDVDTVYGTPEHPLRMPPAYHAFPHDVVDGIHKDYRLGNVGPTGSIFNPLHGEVAFGYTAYDSWLTMGDNEGMYLIMNFSHIDFDQWTETQQLLAPRGVVGFMSDSSPPPVEPGSRVLVAQVSYNATARGPSGYATAWVGGSTNTSLRWSYAATWQWTIDSPRPPPYG